MAEYQMKDMTGSLFVNDKGDNDKRPDMRGDVMINGVKFSVSAWNNEAKNGKKYLGLKVSEWQEKPASNGAGQAMDDEIPF